MNRNSKSERNGSPTILIGTLIVLTVLGACQNRVDKDDEGKPASGTSPAAPPAAKITFDNGQAILTLDQQTQSRMGIEFSTLTLAVTRPRIAVPAVVLSVQDLATFRNGYIAMQSQIEKDRVDTDVARKEYSRLKILFDNKQNISEKALQSAEGSLRLLEVDERTAEQQLNLQASITEQQWGNVVAKWAMDGSPEFERLVGMRAGDVEHIADRHFSCGDRSGLVRAQDIHASGSRSRPAHGTGGAGGRRGGVGRARGAANDCYSHRVRMREATGAGQLGGDQVSAPVRAPVAML